MSKICVFLLLVALLTGSCSRKTPAQRSAVLVESGKALFAKKQYPRASIQFRKAFQVDPHNAEAYYQFGLLSVEMREYGLALSAFQKANEVDPKHIGAQVKISELLAAVGGPELAGEALKRAQAAVSAAPKDASALNALAVAELRNGKTELAMEHFQEALSNSPENIRSVANLANVKLIQHDTAGALKLLEDMAAKMPKSAEAAQLLGEGYVAAGKPEFAEKQFRRALQLDPKNEKALLALGALQLKAGRPGEAEQTYKELSKSSGSQSAATLALYYWQTKRPDLAIAEFKRLVARDPNDRLARSRLIAAYAESGKLDEAAKVVDAALKGNPRDAEARLQRSELLLRQAKADEAMKILRELAADRHDSVQAHYLLAKAYALRRDPKMQQQELAEALKIDPKLLAIRIEWSDALLASRDPRTALQVLSDAPAAQKTAVNYHEARVRALLAAGDMAEARKEIDTGLAAARTPPLIYSDALYKIAQRQYAAARTSLNEILRSTPDPGAVQLLAQSYAAEKRTDLAVAAVREQAAKVPNAAPLQFLLAHWLLTTGDRSGGRAVLEAVRKLDNRFEPAALAVARLDLAEGKAVEARRLVDPLIAQNPNDENALQILAEAGMAEGKTADSAREFRKVLEQNPDNLEALNNLACLLGEQGNVDEALQFAQKAKELAPNNPSVDDTLGWLFYKKGLYPTAVRYLESAVASGASPIRKYHLAMTYARLGDGKRSRKAYEEAFRINPNLPEAKQAQALLASVRN